MEQKQLTPLPLMLTVRLGIRHLPIKLLTRMKPGDVLTLEQALNQPLDLLVGEKLIGKCEVISLQEKLGIRIVELYEFPVSQGCNKRKPQ
ncbi:MAG: FliM/FliN family flagellar motor switch protein [Sulfuricella sp.]|nr:FliM/FliN family flagellar motor switch protein [Sulfuricella sp.]